MILVTGATGFVGSRLLTRLAAGSDRKALRGTARTVRAGAWFRHRPHEGRYRLAGGA